MALEGAASKAEQSITATGDAASNATVVNDSAGLKELLSAIAAIHRREPIDFILRLNKDGRVSKRMPELQGATRGAWDRLTADEQAVLRKHKLLLIDIVERGALSELLAEFSAPKPDPLDPPPTLPTPEPREPEPVVMVGNHRITVKEVEEYLDDCGLLPAYKAGRLLKSDAYAQTKAAMLQLREFSLGRPTPILTGTRPEPEARQPRRAFTGRRTAPLLRRTQCTDS
jgi:hypothetical protein